MTDSIHTLSVLNLPILGPIGARSGAVSAGVARGASPPTPWSAYAHQSDTLIGYVYGRHVFPADHIASRLTQLACRCIDSSTPSHKLQHESRRLPEVAVVRHHPQYSLPALSAAVLRARANG